MPEISHAAPELRLFDACAIIGSASRPPLAPALSPETLLAEMDLCGIDEALVHTAETQIGSPLVTNPRVADWCAPHPRLHPVWNILPRQTGEMPLDTLFPDMRRHGVRALCARPEENRFLLNSLTFGPLFEELAARRVPLFLTANWERITGVLREFPQLTVIAFEASCWGQDRYWRPLLEHFPRFYLETSTLELDGGIPALVRTYGAERLLFGSGYHNKAMGGASLLLRNLDIAPDAKALIAHGNLERLLKEVEV